MKRSLLLTIFLITQLFQVTWAGFGVDPIADGVMPDTTEDSVASDLLNSVRQAYAALSDVEKGITPDPCPRRRGDYWSERSQTTLPGVDGSDIPMDVISYEYLEHLFRDFARERRIPFGYPEDGCYARAHAMTRMLERRGITAGKVFIEGYLRVETPNSPKGYVEWGYHVAPVVMVRRNGVVRPYVIDPSLFQEPVPVERWYHTQTSHAEAYVDRTYFTNQEQYWPHRGTSLNTSGRYKRDEVKDMNSTMKEYLKIQRQRREGSPK